MVRLHWQSTSTFFRSGSVVFTSLIRLNSCLYGSVVRFRVVPYSGIHRKASRRVGFPATHRSGFQSLILHASLIITWGGRDYVQVLSFNVDVLPSLDSLRFCTWSDKTRFSALALSRLQTWPVFLLSSQGLYTSCLRIWFCQNLLQKKRYRESILIFLKTQTGVFGPQVDIMSLNYTFWMANYTGL